MIGDITSKQIYDIEGTTSPLATGYEFTFPYPGADSIEVFTTGGLTDTAVTSTNWTVDASGATPKVVFAEGYVFPDDQTKLTIIRKVGYTQTLDLRNGDTIDADKLEEALDEIIMQVQQVEEKTTRAVLSSVSDTVQISIPDAGSRGGMLLGFDSTGAAVPILTTDIQQKLTQALAAETHTITLEGQAQGAKADAVEAKTAAQAAQLAAETAQSGAEAAQTASQGLYDSIETKTTESLGTINTAKTTAVGAVTTQQATSVAAVEAAQATALSEISTAKTTATGAVTSARATAVSAVQSQQSTSVGAVQSAQSSATSAISSYATSMETALDTYTDGKKDEISSWTDTKKGEVTSAATTGVTSVQSAATTAEGNLDDHVGETSDTGTTTLMGKLNAKTASSVATLEAMIETIPQDYSSLSLKAKECTYRIENLEAMASGALYTEHTESTSGGVLSLPSSSPLAPWAEVEKVEGKSESYSSVLVSSLTWRSVADEFLWAELPNLVPTTSNTEVGSVRLEGYETVNMNTLYRSSNGHIAQIPDNTRIAITDSTYVNDPSGFVAAKGNLAIKFHGTADSLHSSTLSSVVSKSANLCTHGVENGNCILYGGIDDSIVYADDNALVGGETYTVSFKNTAGGVLFKRERINGTWGSNVNLGSVRQATFTVSSGADRVNLWVYEGTQSAISEVQIQRGSTATAYKPQTTSSLTLPSLTLKGVGSACDTYTPSTGKVTRKVAEMTIASSDVTLNDVGSYSSIQYCAIRKKGAGYGNIDHPILAEGFTFSDSTYDWDNASKVGHIFTGASYNYWWLGFTSGTTLEQMQTALTGKKIVYELATSTEETSTTIDPYISVEAGGSVSVVSTSAQAEASVHYLTDLT